MNKQIGIDSVIIQGVRKAGWFNTWEDLTARLRGSGGIPAHWCPSVLSHLLPPLLSLTSLLPLSLLSLRF